MRKSIVWLVAFAFVVIGIGLVGCGGGKQESSQTASPAKQESVTDLLSKGRNLPGLTYDYVMTAKDTKMNGKVWVAGKKIKSEMVMENQKIISILDGDANVLYSYMPEQNMAMKMAFDPSKVSKSPDQYSKELDAAKIKVLETTTYDGIRCKVLLMQETEGKGQTKMWVREDYGIPLRVEVTDPSGESMVMEYKNIKIGAQSADIFKLPAGVEVTDMSEMMKNLPKQ